LGAGYKNREAGSRERSSGRELFLTYPAGIAIVEPKRERSVLSIRNITSVLSNDKTLKVLWIA
jgi:hypothetical protein